MKADKPFVSISVYRRSSAAIRILAFFQRHIPIAL